MGECVTACCLVHRRPVFRQDWGPDTGKWCHGNGWSCEDAMVITVSDGPGNMPLGRMLQIQADAERLHGR